MLAGMKRDTTAQMLEAAAPRLGRGCHLFQGPSVTAPQFPDAGLPLGPTACRRWSSWGRRKMASSPFMSNGHWPIPSARKLGNVEQYNDVPEGPLDSAATWPGLRPTRRPRGCPIGRMESCRGLWQSSVQGR
jgi:hypothetical protein